MVKTNIIIKNFKTDRFIVKKFSLKLVNKDYLNWFKDKIVNKFITFNPKNLEDLKKNVSITLKKKRHNIFCNIFKK
jgi:hypothetical protein